MMMTLDITQHRDQIVSRLQGHGCLIITAPPGSGKSTCVPRFFLDANVERTIVVLQPRRIAARGLAAYVSRLLGEKPGQTVGYQVRFDACIGSHTKIIYQTYGVFLKQLLNNPRAEGIGLVILDEFHERTLETDLILAGLSRLRTVSPKPLPFIVMSATLETTGLQKYLGNAPCIDINTATFPVSVNNQSPQPFEHMEQQALRALKPLVGPHLKGSILIFMPGAQEIRALMKSAGPLCAAHQIPLLELHGRLPLDQQMRVLDESAQRPCVIISTNVAETSLTIPGVIVIIDSGYERRAAYDHRQDRNTLYLRMISRQSAIQRAGRAGRTAPGRCIRLWSTETERSMEEAILPEIKRLELSSLVLASLGLIDKADVGVVPPFVLPWLTQPNEERWQHALELLTDMEAVEHINDEPSITIIGSQLLSWPTQPLPARLMLAGQENGVGLISAAIIALWENADRSTKENQPTDLFTAALRLADQSLETEFSRETRQVFDALIGCLDQQQQKQEWSALKTALQKRSLEAIKQLQKKVAQVWLLPMRRKIAIREEHGARFLFADKKAATIIGSDKVERSLPLALLALTVLETAGSSQNRRNAIIHYLALEPEWVAETFVGQTNQENLCRWDEKKQAVVAETRILYAGLVLVRATVPAAQADPEGAAKILAEKIAKGEINLLDDEAQQLALRIRCVAKAFPEQGLPPFNEDDWQQVYEHVAFGKSSRAEMESASLIAGVRDYVGQQRMAMVDSMAPVKIKLPAGKMGKVLYFESTPPELSARMGDLIGYRGRFTICAGRTKGIFNILAPNYRTVQKTEDLGGFWKNSYPKIKNELKRRYPRHPWP